MADIPPDDGAYPVVADAAPLLPVQPELAWDLGTETRDAVSDVYLVTFARLLPGTAQAAGLQDIVFTLVRVGCLSRLFTSMHPPHSPLFNIYVSAVWPTRPRPLVGQGPPLVGQGRGDPVPPCPAPFPLFPSQCRIHINSISV